MYRNSVKKKNEGITDESKEEKLITRRAWGVGGVTFIHVHIAGRRDCLL